MLKPMEDSPHSCIFICSTDPSKIIKTIKTRCMNIEILPLDQDSESDIKIIAEYLNKISKQEAYFPNKDIFRAIAKSQPNSMRSFINKIEMLSAINIIDVDERAMQVISGYSEKVEVEAIDVVRSIVKSIRDKDKADMPTRFEQWKEISAVIKNMKDQPESIRLIMCKYISTALTNMEIKTRNINSYNAFIALGQLLIASTNHTEVTREQLLSMVFKVLFEDQLIK